MGSVASSWVITQPSHMEPDLIVQINQASNAWDLLATGKPRVQLDTEDKQVYVRRIDVRTKVQAGQAAGNLIPSCAVTTEMASISTYLQRVRAEYDHHDTNMMAKWNTSVVDAHRLAMRQGHFQLARNSLLYGMNPSNGEGLLNAPGATALNLPPDSFGNDTVQTYDNGQMAMFLLSQLQALKSATMQLGIPRRFAIVGPQRVLGQWEYQDIVQLTSYQRAGAGSQTTAGVLKDVANGMNGDTIDWGYDDTLIGQGAGGTDAVVITMPEVEKPRGRVFNTNDFATISQGLAANVLQYADVAAPIEIPTPIPGGGTDVLSEMRVSPGWVLRSQAIVIVSMQYS